MLITCNERTKTGQKKRDMAEVYLQESHDDAGYQDSKEELPTSENWRFGEAGDEESQWYHKVDGSHGDHGSFGWVRWDVGAIVVAIAVASVASVASISWAVAASWISTAVA